MDIRDVKKNLNRVVLHDRCKYLFVACILRRHKMTSSFYYEAQLQDVLHDNYLISCPLHSITATEVSHESKET